MRPGPGTAGAPPPPEGSSNENFRKVALFISIQARYGPFGATTGLRQVTSPTDSGRAIRLVIPVDKFVISTDDTACPAADLDCHARYRSEAP
jgi:hypothetical protein